MVIDTSALLAILLNEPEQAEMSTLIENSATRYLCAASLLEAALVIEARKGPAGGRELDLLISRARITIVDFTAELAERARDAWRRWGKGNHPAGLNYCDCCAFALAEQLGEPLLYKGLDFAVTDIVRAT